MMNDKQQMLTTLREVFNRWETLLAGLSEAQITAPQPGDNLSIKDVIAHLRAWQQVSIARLEAAQRNQEPVFPAWLRGSHPDSEEETDEFNARIYETYQEQSWSQVHQAWREGFLRFLELGEAIPEELLLDTERYPWLNGYALFAVLRGSYGHHEEHLEPLVV
jgi:hypothetical protein